MLYYWRIIKYISCCVNPSWRMLSSDSQCWWQQPLPHPSFLSAGCKEEKKRTYPPFSSFYLHQIKAIYSPLLGLGNLCPPASQSMGVLPSSLPVSCSQPLSVEMLSLQTAHSFHHFVVTWSGPLPNKGDHLLWQLSAQQLPQAGKPNEHIGGGVSVSLSSSGGDKPHVPPV